MTGGQVALSLSNVSENSSANNASGIRRLSINSDALKVIKANQEEEAMHIERMIAIEKISGKDSWKTLFK